MHMTAPTIKSYPKCPHFSIMTSTVISFSLTCNDRSTQMKAEAPSNSLNMHSLLRRQSFKAGSMPVAGFPGSQAASWGRYTKQFPVADRLMERSPTSSPPSTHVWRWGWKRWWMTDCPHALHHCICTHCGHSHSLLSPVTSEHVAPAAHPVPSPMPACSPSIRPPGGHRSRSQDHTGYEALKMPHSRFTDGQAFGDPWCTRCTSTYQHHRLRILGAPQTAHLPTETDCALPMNHPLYQAL